MSAFGRWRSHSESTSSRVERGPGRQERWKSNRPVVSPTKHEDASRWMPQTRRGGKSRPPQQCLQSTAGSSCRQTNGRFAGRCSSDSQGTDHPLVERSQRVVLLSALLSTTFLSLRIEIVVASQQWAAEDEGLFSICHTARYERLDGTSPCIVA